MSFRISVRPEGSFKIPSNGYTLVLFSSSCPWFNLAVKFPRAARPAALLQVLSAWFVLLDLECYPYYSDRTSRSSLKGLDTIQLFFVLPLLHWRICED